MTIQTTITSTACPTAVDQKNLKCIVLAPEMELLDQTLGPREPQFDSPTTSEFLWQPNCLEVSGEEISA